MGIKLNDMTHEKCWLTLQKTNNYWASTVCVLVSVLDVLHLSHLIFTTQWDRYHIISNLQVSRLSFEGWISLLRVIQEWQSSLISETFLTTLLCSAHFKYMLNPSGDVNFYHHHYWWCWNGVWWLWTWFYFLLCLTWSYSRTPGRASSHPLMREWETRKSSISRPLEFGGKAHRSTQEFCIKNVKCSEYQVFHSLLMCLS